MACVLTEYVQSLLSERRAGEEERQARNESDLRGSLDNDSLTEEERNQIEADRLAAEKSAELREQDYQLAYAIDLLKGLRVISSDD